MNLSSLSRVFFSQRAFTLGLGALLILVGLPVASAQAATDLRVDLRVLLLADGGAGTAAIASTLDSEGVPYTVVDLTSAARPALTAAYLENAATGDGLFQAVVLPNQAGTATQGLTAAELTVLSTYERRYGVRQVDAYVYPGARTGQAAPTYTGALDGATATVTAAGLAGPFSYLKGSVPIDNFDPAVTEVYGYLAAPAPAAGQTFTSLLDVTVGASTGSVVGVYANGFREELVITAGFGSHQQVFNEIGHGIVTWMTRGLHLGYHRNYFDVQIDDIFLADARWSSTGQAAARVRMTPTDVTRLTDWQNDHGFKLDMVFVGSGSDLAAAANGGTDPLTTSLLTAQSQFTWINHTYSHHYLGCIRIAQVAPATTWRCATRTDTGPYVDAKLSTDQTPIAETEWLSQAKIISEIQLNQAWATAHHLTNFDPAVLVTGEHSGLLALPQQTVDNPLLAPALTATGITVTASDASRESASRLVQGSTSTVTVPRRPMNIFYNVGTYADEVSEYNWFYAPAPDGNCTASTTTTCITTPLLAATPAEAQASFESSIKPLEVRNAYADVVSGAPRPFYAHQSNLAEDGILYPVLNGVLNQYEAVYDTAKSPVFHATMKEQAQALAWGGGAHSGVTAYVDSAGVHVSNPAGIAVPLTVPIGTTVNGPTLAAYDGEMSGWISAHPAGKSPAVAGPHPDGQRFPYGIVVAVVAVVGMLGLSMPRGAFTRRQASRRSRREMKESRYETMVVREDRDRAVQELDDEPPGPLPAHPSGTIDSPSAVQGGQTLTSREDATALDQPTAPKPDPAEGLGM